MTFRYTVAGSAAQRRRHRLHAVPVWRRELRAGARPGALMTPVVDGPEGDETVTSRCSMARDTTWARASASVTIADPPDAGRVGGGVRPGRAGAGLETGRFRFTRTGDPTWRCRSHMRGGTATNMTDYANIGGTVTSTPARRHGGRIGTRERYAGRRPRDVILTVTDGANYDLGAPISATVTITDQPAPIITVTAVDPTAIRDGAHPGIFRFTRVGNTALALTVSSRGAARRRAATMRRSIGVDRLVPGRRRRPSIGWSRRRPMPLWRGAKPSSSR